MTTGDGGELSPGRGAHAGTPRRGRGAPLRTLIDRTPLDAERIDVGVRIGWLLRMARLTGGGGVRRQIDMRESLRGLGMPTTSTALSRLESGHLRVGRLVDGYEQVLGLPVGRLRAPIDLTCRAFPGAPSDRDPGVERNTVSSLSTVSEPVLAGGATGGQWMRWARAMAQPDAKGLPEQLVLELLSRLISEVGRAVGPAYAPRYHALAMLRCSAYGELVRDVVDALLADADCQATLDVFRVVGQRGDAPTWAWAVRHLDDPRPAVVRGAVACMETVLSRPGFEHGWWFDALEPLHDALVAVPEPSEHRDALTDLFHLLPADLRRGLAPHVGATRPPESIPAVGTERTEAWMHCAEIAAEVTHRVGMDQQPVLARLIFDVLIGTRERSATTGLLLLASVPFTATVVELLAEAAAASDGPELRERAHRRLRHMRAGTFPEALTGWFDERPRCQLTALTLAAQSGHPLPREVVTGLLPAGSHFARGALRAAGLAADPVLGDLEADPVQPDHVRGAARWWLSQGGRVIDQVA